jgi:NADH-quinone oxidoreductase subunit N
VIAAINSVIAFVYYFRVIVQMWFRPAVEPEKRAVEVPQALFVTIGIAAVIVLVVGIYPQLFGQVGETIPRLVGAG